MAPMTTVPTKMGTCLPCIRFPPSYDSAAVLTPRKIAVPVYMGQEAFAFVKNRSIQLYK